MELVQNQEQIKTFKTKQPQKQNWNATKIQLEYNQDTTKSKIKLEWRTKTGLN